MMNCGSHSRAIILAGTLVSACANNAEQVAIVNSEAYTSRECWFDENGDFVAFLVLAREGRIAAPEFISTMCLVNGDYASLGEVTLRHLGMIRMDDSFGILQRALPDVEVTDNVRSHAPMPYPHDKIYYYKARVTTVPSSGRTIYAPQRVIRLIDINISFGSFLDLSREQRESLLREYH